MSDTHAVADSEVQELLALVHKLLDEITQLREQVVTTEAGLLEVQREYDRRLGDLNAAANRLEVAKTSLRARLAGRAPAPLTATATQPAPVPPPEVIQTSWSAEALEVPPEPTSAARKRKLVAHIRYFTDDAAVIERVNGVLKDPLRDVGDMLELLPWGEIWKARATDWETLDNQYNRLLDWRSVLEERLAYWQGEVRRLAEDSRYGLLVKRRKGTDEEWLEFLEDLARRQEAENLRLSHEVKVLEQQVI